jgi:hypothetical protein
MLEEGANVKDFRQRSSFSMDLPDASIYGFGKEFDNFLLFLLAS